MKTLCKEEFFEADDLPLIPVPLPEDYFGEDAGILIRTMTATERAQLEKEYHNKDPREHPGQFRAHVLMSCVVDEHGEAFFEEGDRERLMRKGAPTIEVLFTAACEANGLTKKDVEELEKN